MDQSVAKLWERVTGRWGACGGCRGGRSGSIGRGGCRATISRNGKQNDAKDTPSVSIAGSRLDQLARRGRG